MRTVILLAGTLVAIGCGHKSSPTNGGGDAGTPGETADGGAPPDGYFAPSQLQVSGHVADFESGQALSSPATLTTAALVPPPSVNTSGANFTIADVPPFSTFYLLAASPPDHRLTYNAPTTVTDAPLSDVVAYSVSDAYLAKLRTAFGVTAQSGTATVLVRAVDAMGNAAAGIPGAALVPNATGIKGPYFVDAALQATPAAAATSASGYLVYFNVPSGTLKLAAGAGYTVQVADTPTGADAVSLALALVQKATSTTPTPTNVSFTQQVMPVFVSRGCYNCHSGNGTGRRLGDLVLDGASMKVWTALVQTISQNFNTTRVNLNEPEKSLVLTMPSYENPPDAHPTVVFASATDPDYVKILTWIKEGAKYN